MLLQYSSVQILANGGMLQCPGASRNQCVGACMSSDIDVSNYTGSYLYTSGMTVRCMNSVQQ